MNCLGLRCETICRTSDYEETSPQVEVCYWGESPPRYDPTMFINIEVDDGDTLCSRNLNRADAIRLRNWLTAIIDETEPDHQE